MNNLNIKKRDLIIGLIISIIAVLSIGTMLSVGIGFEYTKTYIIIALILSIISFISFIKKNEVTNILIPIIVIIVVALFKFAFSIIFIPETYVSMLEIKDSKIEEFNTDINLVRKVTKSMAIKKVNKVLGVKYKGIQLSSQFEIDTKGASVQKINNELLWVFPLDYSGLMKWLNSENIPGYITISATDTKGEAKLVLNHAYSMSNGGYFGDSIKRKMWWIAGMKETEIHMEISDKGIPYWIGVVIQPAKGLSIDTITKVIVMNAESESAEIVDIKDIDSKYSWIDRIWPEYIIKERISWYGSLKGGFLNSILQQENINKPTDYKNQELWLVDMAGSIKWFTGMTSVNNNDQSLVEIVFVEAKASKPTLYRIPAPGVSDENGAIEAIESGLGADSLKWDTVLPQPVIYKNVFYWSTSIVSNNGVFQKIGVVKGADISVVRYGNDLNEALSYFFNKKVSSSETTKEQLLQEIMKKITEINELKTKLESL